MVGFVVYTGAARPHNASKKGLLYHSRLIPASRYATLQLDTTSQRLIIGLTMRIVGVMCMILGSVRSLRVRPGGPGVAGSNPAVPTINFPQIEATSGTVALLLLQFHYASIPTCGPQGTSKVRWRWGVFASTYGVFVDGCTGERCAVIAVEEGNPIDANSTTISA